MIPDYRKEFLSYLEERVQVKEPENLYKPIAYILNIGGKRIRPVLSLMSADVFGVDYKLALDAALTIEVFHNFTLIHDDIMDNAPLRRGHETVHEKWDSNIAILSGDAMLILAYQYLEEYDSVTFKKLTKIFSKTAIEVCEGQQLDVDFETRSDVSIEEYVKMISLKASVLIACALKMGAVIANTSEEEANAIYEFGLNLGIAFQLQDDYLDAFGDPKTFGKQIGGDIIENKKTYLYLKTQEASDDKDRSRLNELYSDKEICKEDKVKEVMSLYRKYDVPQLIGSEIERYTKKSFLFLEALNIKAEKKALLLEFATELMGRKV